MKLIKAILRPERFEFVKKALEENGFTGMTIMTVDGQGEQKHFPPYLCDSFNSFDLLPRIQIEMVVGYADVDNIIGTIAGACRNEHVGDCRIYVMPVEKAIRVVKGEICEESLAGGTIRTCVRGFSELIVTGEMSKN